jgi:hypothetical protein
MSEQELLNEISRLNKEIREESEGLKIISVYSKETNSDELFLRR